MVRSGPEVSRRQEMKHDGMTKEPADIINADQSAATFEQTRSDGAVDLSIVQTVQLSVRAYWGSAVRRSAPMPNCSFVDRMPDCAVSLLYIAWLS